MVSDEVRAKRQTRLLFWKGLGYMVTGIVLIISAVVFSGVAVVFLDNPGVHPAGPSAIFLLVFFTGSAWGGILIWKGFRMSESAEYGIGYRLEKLIIVILSKTIFCRHKFRWQRIAQNK